MLKGGAVSGGRCGQWMKLGIDGCEDFGGRGAFVHSLLQGMAGGRSCESTSSIKMQKNKNKKLEYAVRDCLVKMCREIRLDLGSNVPKSDQGDEHIYMRI